MPTLRCRACLRRWRAGGPYRCDCAAPPEPEDRARVELAPLSCLLAAVLLGGWALGWLLTQAWHGVRGLLGW